MLGNIKVCDCFSFHRPVNKIKFHRKVAAKGCVLGSPDTDYTLSEHSRVVNLECFTERDFLNEKIRKQVWPITHWFVIARIRGIPGTPQPKHWGIILQDFTLGLHQPSAQHMYTQDLCSRLRHFLTECYNSRHHSSMDQYLSGGIFIQEQHWRVVTRYKFHRLLHDFIDHHFQFGGVLKEAFS